ncbi:hypothetical protein Rwratislav_46955, partial [Rhodococcus wratislaviensis IFP 2016]
MRGHACTAAAGTTEPINDTGGAGFLIRDPDRNHRLPYRSRGVPRTMVTAGRRSEARIGPAGADGHGRCHPSRGRCGNGWAGTIGVVLVWSVVDESLRWAALSAWIRAWDPFVDQAELRRWAGELRRWAAGLSWTAAGIDPRIRWHPETDTVTAPATYTGADVEQCLR